MKKGFLLIASMLILSCCGNFQSREDIQKKINGLHDRINVLQEEIALTQRDINSGVSTDYTGLQEMKDNLHDYQIQLDELNRKLVNTK